MKKFETSRLLWLVAGHVGWVLIAALSLVPAGSRPHTPVGGAYEHVLAYAAVGFCFGLGYLSMRRRVLACSAVTLSAMIFEFLQSFIPGRNSELMGFMASTIGVWSGLAVASAVIFILARETPMGRP